MSARPLRVAYVSHSSGLSGAESALERMLAELDRAAVEPVVLLPEEGPLRARLDARGIAVRIQPTRWWIPATHWSARTFWNQLEGLEARCDALFAALESLRPDIVHTNVLVTLEGAAAAARAGLPHVWHSRGLFGHGFPPPYLDEVPYFFGVVGRLGDRLVCVSRAVESQAEPWIRSRRVVIPDGFDPEPLRNSPVTRREELFARLGIPDDARLVVSLGGIQRRKGQVHLVEAMAHLRDAFPEIVAVLAGGETDADYGNELRALVASRGLAGAVLLPGPQEDVRSLLTHAEVFVHPSLSEGFSLAVLEALACGSPVVAVRSGGPEEIVEDGRSGLLVEPAEPERLARAIRRILTEPDLAATLRHEGPLRASRFSPQASASRLVEVYRDLHPPASAEAASRSAAAAAACSKIVARARLAAAAS